MVTYQNRYAIPRGGRAHGQRPSHVISIIRRRTTNNHELKEAVYCATLYDTDVIFQTSYCTPDVTPHRGGGDAARPARCRLRRLEVRDRRL